MNRRGWLQVTASVLIAGGDPDEVLDVDPLGQAGRVPFDIGQGDAIEGMQGLHLTSGIPHVNGGPVMAIENLSLQATVSPDLELLARAADFPHTVSCFVHMRYRAAGLPSQSEGHR